MSETAAAKGRKLTKNEKRRLRKKAGCEDPATQNGDSEMEISHKENEGDSNGNDVSNDVEIEYISADLSRDPTAMSIMDQFKMVFEKFAKPEELTSAASVSAGTNGDGGEGSSERIDGENNDDNDGDNAQNGPKKLSKKKKRLMSRLSVAELKQLVQRPDVVEAHDVTSSDPRLLVYLKAYRNTTPVPRHWCHKRKYLQGKRGIEKPPFQLPEFIADTGIAKIRESVLESEALKKSKQKARDRLQPKTGKIDIDYQVLHDAFFKFQKKPKMTGHGDLYYEGKEYEVNMKEKKPGMLSDELKQALGMVGIMPPPWLINMQRFGPPPAYPSLRIPGLNAPLPEGASFGYHPGGWGKPPVDEYGRPLYGDVFGALAAAEGKEIEVDRTRWGQMIAAEEEEISDSDDDDAAGSGAESDEETTHKGGNATPNTIDGFSSMQSGLETPAAIDLRKRTGQETPDHSVKELYHVIQEKTANAGANGQFFGSDRTYVLPSAARDDNNDTGVEGTASEVTGSNTEDGERSRRKRKSEASSGSSNKRQKDFKF